MSDKITSKPKYKVIKSGDVDYSDDSKVLQPKVDGAHTIIALHSDRPNELYSYRTSKRTGGVIDHTNQVPAIRDLSIPDIFNKTILRGELYGKENGRPIPAEQVGGILNSSVEKSLSTQREKGWLKPLIFDVVEFRGKNVAKDPYKTKLSLIRRISDALPELQVAETASTPEQKKALVEKIKAGKHPDTKEGVIEWDLNKPTGDPKKIKFRDNYEVFVRDIFPAVDKHGKIKSEAGGFSFSWGPKGKVVGTVGTGFSRDKRIDMLKNPDNYIGGVARVKSSQKYESGALRAPSFYSMHVEKNIKEAAFIDELQKIAEGPKMLRGSHAVIRDKDGNILLTESWRGYTNLPGGKLDSGEGYRVALRRELFEELGLKVNDKDIKHLINAKGVLTGKDKADIPYSSRIYDVTADRDAVKNMEPQKINLVWASNKDVGKIKNATNMVKEYLKLKG